MTTRLVRARLFSILPLLAWRRAWRAGALKTWQYLPSPSPLTPRTFAHTSSHPSQGANPHPHQATHPTSSPIPAITAPPSQKPVSRIPPQRSLTLGGVLVVQRLSGSLHRGCPPSVMLLCCYLAQLDPQGFYSLRCVQ